MKYFRLGIRNEKEQLKKLSFYLHMYKINLIRKE